MSEPPLLRLEPSILDDRAIVRQGGLMLVQDLRGGAWCRRPATAAEAVRLMDAAPAELAVAGPALKGESGLGAIVEPLRRWPPLRIGVHFMHAHASAAR